MVAGAVRTPIGRFGGGLAGVSAAELGAVAARAALERTGVPASAVEQVIFGHARQAGNGPNLARQVVKRAGLADTVPAFTINMACASGLMAVIEAARAVALGEAEVVLAGGAENMSRIPFLMPDGRWGKKLGDLELVDAMYRDGYLCPLCNQVMGETAETLVTEYGITREEQDEYALASQARAAAAWADGRFAEEVAPVVTRDAKGRETRVERDEHPRADTSLEGLAKLAPVFKKAARCTPATRRRSPTAARRSWCCPRTRPSGSTSPPRRGSWTPPRWAWIRRAWAWARCRRWKSCSPAICSI